MKKILFIFLFICKNSSIILAQDLVVLNQKDIQKILIAHNKERHLVGVSDLVWDDSIANFAKNWASFLAGEDNGLKHRKNNAFGENLASFNGYDFSADFGVNLWLREKKDYKYSPIENNNNQKAIGHYTQLVWKNSTKVGCACVQSKSKTFYFVCNYDPPGNYIGEFPY